MQALLLVMFDHKWARLFTLLHFTPQKMQLDELKVLHRVAYNRPGSGNEIKKNLRKFNGFSYTKDDKKYQSKVMTVER